MRLAVAAPAQAGPLAVRILADFDEIARPYLVVRLVEKGVVELADQMAALAGTGIDGYEAIYRMLASARSTRDLITRMVSLGISPPIPRDAAASSPVDLVQELFDDNDITFASEVDKGTAADWAIETLEMHVGGKLSVYLTETDTDLFESFTSDEEAREFLRYRMPGHQDFIRQQVRILKEEIRDHPEILPSAKKSGPSPGMPSIRVLAYVANVLAEWIEIGRAQGSAAFARFMLTNESAIASATAHELLEAACRLSETAFSYEGLLYLVHEAISTGIDDAIRFIEDSVHRHSVYADLLAQSNGTDLYLAGFAAHSWIITRRCLIFMQR